MKTGQIFRILFLFFKAPIFAFNIMLQSSTTGFLTLLKKNNNKPWFDQNREKYISAKNNFEEFVKEIISLTSAFDKDIKLLEIRNCTFRINRDIRFSKDKTPYNTHWSSFLKRATKQLRGGYYLKIKPGSSFPMATSRSTGGASRFPPTL